MATRNSVVFINRRDSIERFLSEFDPLIALCQPFSSYLDLSMPIWQPRPGRALEVARRRVIVDRMSGPAAQALDSVGVSFQYARRGTTRTVAANPVSMWSTLLDDPTVTVDLVRSRCNLAIGLLTAEIDGAVEHEESIDGNVRRVVGTPWRLVRAGFGRTAYAPRVDALGTAGCIIAGLVVAFLALHH